MSKRITKIIFTSFLVMFLIVNNKITLNTNSSIETNDLPTLEADLPIIIDDDSDFGPSGYNFPGSGTEMEPYIIEGYNIEAQTIDDIGILVQDTTKHFEIRDNDITISSSLGSAADVGISVINVAPYTAKIINNHIGWYYINIYVEEAEGVIVEDNDCENPGIPGILLDNCPHSRVENNLLYSGGPHLAIESKSSEDESNFRAEIEGDYYGIYLDHCSDSNITLNIMDLDSQTKGAGIAVFYSSRILIDENEVTNVNIPHIDFEQYEKGGIYLKSVMNSTVFKNTVDQIDKCNLYLTRCNLLLVSNNTFSRSEETGISLYYTTNSTIVHNIIQDHPSFGVEITIESDDNIIHHNHFIDNNIGGSQGSDSGINNTWWDTNTDEGNWWNDWTGGNYVIAGTAGSIDPFPLGEPVPVPEFSKTMVILMLFIPTSILSILIIRRRKNT